MTLWSLEAASRLSTTAAEGLALFALAGILSGIVRYRRASRPDLLFATLVFLVGTFVAQLPVYIAGMTGWGIGMVYLSAAGRAVQITGCALFVRGSLKDQCPPWAWKTVTLLVLALTLVI